ncbi:MAG: hypothetical protein QME90_13615, partial [Thermodesulfobacteriota bacterium]|nr:hypothetical protein [Thermodesulfobacteriota bacterium]
QSPSEVPPFAGFTRVRLCNWKVYWALVFSKSVNPVRNSNGALNPAGIILKCNPSAKQRGIISNGVNPGESNNE